MASSIDECTVTAMLHRVDKQTTNQTKVLSGKRLDIQYALIIKSHAAVQAQLQVL
ncbi:hypothetical protein GBA52_021321, partial [Prunus armeniaca]